MLSSWKESLSCKFLQEIYDVEIQNDFLINLDLTLA